MGRSACAHAFMLLADHHVISTRLAMMLQDMVGFRNIAAHNYQEKDQAVLIFVIEKNVSFYMSLNAKKAGER